MPLIYEFDPSSDLGPFVMSLVEQGRQCVQEKKFDEAYINFGQAVGLAPEEPLVLINYGAALSDGGNTVDGERFTRDGLAKCSNNTQRAICHNNLGHIAYLHRDFDKADQEFRKSIEEDPYYKAPRVSLGANMVLQGKWWEAYTAFENASLMFPDDWEPLMNRAICMLTMGNWQLGLPGYEKRQLAGGALQFEANTKAPRWMGEDLTGKNLAIWPDQGLGDCIYCHRLVREAAKRANHVYFMTYTPLEGILPEFPNMTVLREGNRAENIHYQAPVMSLMNGLRTDPLNPPPPSGLTVKWDPRKNKHIGLCWSGNVSHKYDDVRSMPAKVMIDAVRELYPDSELHCLQKDVRPYDEEASKNTIWHYITTVHDLADAASRMHMVISCDTLTLHVAAEMGIPTIGLIAFSPDFRWLLDREDCPWYPSLRLMRRRWHGEPWADVIKRIS